MTLFANTFVCLLNNAANNVSSYDEGSYQQIIRDLVPDWVCDLEYNPVFWALIGSLLIGLSGVLPLLIIPIDQTDNLKQGDGANQLKVLLSFAVGGLLGDVFLHSLPEIWAHDAAKNGGHPSMDSGKWILTGLVTFVSFEKFFSVMQHIAEDKNAITNSSDSPKDNTHENNNTKGALKTENKKSSIAGYLNLIANTLDNFTHGLSLGGAFLVSLRLGLLTTFAILVHEIPHEVGDFAILLSSGFTRFHAAIWQMVTAGGGLLGAMSAIMFSGVKNSLDARNSWILPFTSGTFLHIALVTILPELLKEECPKESIKQLSGLLVGIVIMAVVTNVVE